MHYLISLFSCAFVLALQYFLSMWLIKIGWFYGYAWAMGGFLVFFFIAISILMLFFKNNRNRIKNNIKNKNKSAYEINRLGIQEGNHQSNSGKICLTLVFLGGFWLNLEMGWYHEKYEYDTFGIKTKAVITKKFWLQNKGRSYIFVLQTQEKPQSKKLKMSVLSDEYALRNVGDTIAILYTPRYSSMIKVL